LRKLFIFLFVFLILMNPYTIYGAMGSVAALLLFLLCLIKYGKYLYKEYVFSVCLLILLSCVGVISSYFHGILQFEQLKISLSLLVCIVLGQGFFFYFRKRKLTFNDFVYISLVAFSVNSAVILLQVIFPAVRSSIESILVPSGNIDWTQGHRYRGLASGGAASFSLAIPVAVTACLYLYVEKYINIVKLIVFILILTFSLFFIGRTGFLLMPVVFVAFFIFNAHKYFKSIVAFSILMLAVIFITFDWLKEFLLEQQGEWFFEYSLGFLLDGVKGIEREGTVSTIKEFLTVVPTEFPEVMFGYGFYGGSSFHPWTDSGYSRMFLSIGWVFGIFYYLVYTVMIFPALKYKPFLFCTLTMLLLIAEAKEPLIFSGYASRFYFIALLFAIAEKRFEVNQKRQARG